ncbi:MAG: tetratricopeptide repeat protein [Chitinophagaceae bacterium]|nr:tetratricopeptide repeat protein [Chitinophagaceae bacterium]
MKASERNIFRIILFALLAATCITTTAQKKLGLDAEQWAMLLSANKQNEVNSLGSLTQQLVKADSARAFQFLDSLETSKHAKGYYFRMYFSMVKADFLYARFGSYDKYKDRSSPELKPLKEQLEKLYTDALDAAYHTEADLYIGWVNFYSARKMLHFGETSWAVMHSKNGVDLFEKIKYPVEPPVYTELADLLYRVREYDESIVYAKKGIEAWKQLNYEKEYETPYKFRVKALNTIGNSFYQKKLNDSAIVYFSKALLAATGNKDSLLTGEVLGNIGRIVYAQNNFDSALKLFQTDYQRNKNNNINNEAADAAVWIAKTKLSKGNSAVALTEVKEALRLLQLWPNAPYLRDAYFTLAQIYRAMRKYDSAFYYTDHYRVLNDSIEKEVATSSLAISKARLNDEVSRYNIEKINKEKREQIFTRNIIIAGIVVLSLIALLIINRGRLKHKMAVEKSEQEKRLMEQEIHSAKEQMQIFTGSIIEKTNLIEKLELQIKDRQATEEQASIMEDLMQHTILTEEDWMKFKNLFEKIYPFFFQQLKEKAPDITIAEQRMASLTRLQLTTRQMASMLGISPDSVHKTRQRLRQRLGISNETNLEEYLGTV